MSTHRNGLCERTWGAFGNEVGKVVPLVVGQNAAKVQNAVGSAEMGGLQKPLNWVERGNEGSQLFRAAQNKNCISVGAGLGSRVTCKGTAGELSGESCHCNFAYTSGVAHCAQ